MNFRTFLWRMRFYAYDALAEGLLQLSTWAETQKRIARPKAFPGPRGGGARSRNY